MVSLAFWLPLFVYFFRGLQKTKGEQLHASGVEAAAKLVAAQLCEWARALHVTTEAAGRLVPAGGRNRLCRCGSLREAKDNSLGEPAWGHSQKSRSSQDASFGHSGFRNRVPPM